MEDAMLINACEPGRYGCNCSQICTPGTFGLNCYFTCNCSDEVCDPKVGCTSINETSVFTTARPYITEKSSVHYAVQSEIHYTRLPLVISTPDNKLLPLNEITLSLLISSAAVVFFSVLCAFILIRLSKRIYKREYRKLLNNLQLTGMRSEDENIYSECNYTDSSMLNTRICPSTDLDDSYDHSVKENYNILSLRSRTSRVNQYDVESNSTSPSLHSITSQQFLDESEADFVLEPECLINLFQENQRQQTDTSHEDEQIH
ncbi:uncharacterized protein LOC134228873 isoform X2 [Saccostrea cucullata]|uniref:uncharacterized protein LOC134228873 isoform X2 n=1 Tax=Saccostrea cuccullata TaxID=36930 RepID=UPI002ED1D79A